MTIREIFHPASMPKEILVTPNESTVTAIGVKPETFGWQDTRVITSPEELMIPEWLESTWNIGDTVDCICPAEIEGERRLKDNNPRVSLLGLDFDSPDAPRLEDLKRDLKDFAGFWYTTKSHQKDKHGVVCDRYRCFLAYSRPVSHEENHIIHDLLAAEIGHDEKCGDGTRLYYPSVVGCEYGTFGGSAAIDVEWLLSLAPSKTRQDAPGLRCGATKVKRQAKPRIARAGLFDSDGNPIAYRKATPYYVGKVRKAWDTLEKKNPSARHADVYRLMVKLIKDFGNEIEQYRAALLSIDELRDFYTKNKHQWQGLDATIQDAWDYNQSANRLDTKNPVAYIDGDSLETSDLVETTSKLAIAVKGEGDFEAEARIIDAAFKTHTRAIIDFGCGCGKTLVTTAYLSRDGYKGKTVIVKDTLRSARTQKDLLERMGIEPSEVTIITGWEKPECLRNIEKQLTGFITRQNKQGLEEAHKHATKNNWQLFYNPVESPCLNCCCCDSCDFNHSRTPQRVTEAINGACYVVMAHSRFLSFFDWYEASCDMRVIVDEEPSIYETVTLKQSEVDTVVKTFNRVLKGIVQKHLYGLLAIPNKGTIKDTLTLKQDEAKRLKAVCKDLPATDKETCYKVINHYKGNCQRFAFVEDTDEGKRITLGKNRLNLSFTHPCYILTASSPFSNVEWDGFTVVRNTDKPSLDNVTVYAYLANHTRASLEANCYSYFKKVVERLVCNDRKKVLIVINKPDGKIKETQKALGWLTIMLAYRGIGFELAFRGSTKGRNDWSDCDAVILCYGLFTSVSDVAVKTSLIEGSEVDESRIWFEAKENRKGQAFQQPKIHAGFSDKGLRETDRRLVCDELYQTAMRGRARMYRGDSMDVFCMVPSADYVTPLLQVMDNCQIKTVLPDRVTELTAIPKEDLLKGDTDLTATLGLPNNPENRDIARKTASELLG